MKTKLFVGTTLVVAIVLVAVALVPAKSTIALPEFVTIVSTIVPDSGGDRATIGLKTDEGKIVAVLVTANDGKRHELGAIDGMDPVGNYRFYVDGNHWIVTEKDFRGPNVRRWAFLSTDGGKTWKTRPAGKVWWSDDDQLATAQ